VDFARIYNHVFSQDLSMTKIRDQSISLTVTCVFMLLISTQIRAFSEISWHGCFPCLQGRILDPVPRPG
jgi:hypothetical protein